MTLAPRGLVELDGTEKIGKVGQRKRGHPVLAGMSDVVIDTHCAIDD